MKSFSENTFKLIFSISLIITATSVANPAGDLFQIIGSFKVSDIVFLIVLFGLLFVTRYYGHTALSIKSSPCVSALLFSFFFFVVLSILANIGFMSERMLMHLLRLMYYICISYVFSYISTYYMSAQQILFAMYVGACAMCLSILYMMFFLDMGQIYGNEIRKLDSVLGANPVATYAAIFFPIGLFFIKESSGFFVRALFLLSLGLLVAAALLSESKAAWLAMIVSFFIFFISLNKKQKLLTIVLTLLIFWLAFDYIYTIISLEIGSSISNSMQRFDMLVAALDYFANNPFFGIGPSNYVVISPYGTEPHSAYALIFAELGFFGGAAYVLLIFSMFIKLFRHRHDKTNQLLMMVIANIAVLSLFTGLVSTQIILYIFIGLYFGQMARLKMGSSEMSKYYINSKAN